MIALSACGDACDDLSKLWYGVVIYDGPFNPQYHNGYPDNEKGTYQDFNFTLQSDWPTGGTVISATHVYKVGVSTRLCQFFELIF